MTEYYSYMLVILVTQQVTRFKDSPVEETLTRPHLKNQTGDGGSCLQSQLHGMLGGSQSKASTRKKHETLSEK
jgi:hypothetical protein